MLRIAGLDDAGLGHFEPQVVAFARALAYAGEHGVAAMLLGSVVDQLHDDHDFDAGLEHFGGSGLLFESRRGTVNGHALLGIDRAEIVHWIADDVDDAAECIFADRRGDGPAEINGVHASYHAFGGLHRDAADAAFAEVLLHFEHHVDGRGHFEAVAGDAQGLINGRHGRLCELHVHSRAGDLNYFSDIFSHKFP